MGGRRREGEEEGRAFRMSAKISMQRGEEEGVKESRKEKKEES